MINIGTPDLDTKTLAIFGTKKIMKYFASIGGVYAGGLTQAGQTAHKRREHESSHEIPR